MEQHLDHAVLRIRVQPRARKTEVSGVHGQALKIRLQAPPVDGKANRALLKYLAKRLDIPVSAIRLAAGESSRDKIIHLVGVSADTVRAAFPEAAGT